MSDPLHVHFEDLEVGQVVPLGACAVDQGALDVFVERFQPGWDVAYGAPDAMIFRSFERANRTTGLKTSRTRPAQDQWSLARFFR